MATATAAQPPTPPALRHVRCYDNGGKTADRYTAVYMHIKETRECFGARGMNAHPFHPQGIGMYTSAQPGPHLGQPIAFENLPSDCQKLVLQDLKED